MVGGNDEAVNKAVDKKVRTGNENSDAVKHDVGKRQKQDQRQMQQLNTENTWTEVKATRR